MKSNASTTAVRASVPAASSTRDRSASVGSSPHHQLSLGPTQLRGSEQPSDAFRNSEQEPAALGNAERAACELLNAAFTRAGLENKEIAHLCGVSVSLVEKWRSADARGCPSFVQMLLLPPAFHLALNKELNGRFGFGRAALLDLLDAVGRLALTVEG